MFKSMNKIVLLISMLFAIFCGQSVDQIGFNYTKYVTQVSGIGYVHDYPDSDYVVDNIIIVNSEILLIPVYDIYQSQQKYDTGFIAAIGTKYTSLEKLKNGQRGQLRFLGHKGKKLFIVFDCFVKHIDDVVIKTLDPPYCKIFSFSELWMIDMSNNSYEKLDEDVGEFENLQIFDRKIEVDIHNRGSSEIYFSK